MHGLHAFLDKIGTDVRGELWISGPEMTEFERLSGEFWSEPPSQAAFSSHPPGTLIQEQEKGILCVSLFYPGNYLLLFRMEKDTSLSMDQQEMLYFYLYPYYTERALERSEFKLEKMIDSIARTTSSLEPDDLLSNILTNTMKVIPNADLGTLWNYDEETGRLFCRASAGNLLKGIRKMRFVPGEGPIGYTFSKGIPLLFRDSSEITNTVINGISEENSRYWDNSYDFEKNIQAVLTCPIYSGNQVRCVMFFCQFPGKKPFTDQDLRMLEGFSSQVGIAMENSNQYDDIRKLNEILLKRDDIHATLTNLSLENMGVGKMIREMNRMMERPIVFIDLIEKDYITFGGKAPEDFSYTELYRYLIEQESLPFYEVIKGGELTHLMYPIRSGTVLLGCLVITAQKPLGPLDRLILEQGHSILALELVRKQNMVEFYYKKKREQFHDLVKAEDDSVILKRAMELGIKEEARLQVVLLRLMSYPDPQTLEIMIHRMISDIQKEVAPYIQTIFGYNDEVTLLIQIVDSVQELQFKKQLNQLVARWTGQENLTISAGAGMAYEDLRMIGNSMREAKAALTYLITRQQNGFTQYSDIGVNRLFIHQDIGEIEQFLNEIFGPLESSKGEGASLAETLIAYFRTNRHAAKTASLLHVHINTLYQRIKKIEGVLNLSLDEPEDVLKLQLACHLKESFHSAKT